MSKLPFSAQLSVACDQVGTHVLCCTAEIDLPPMCKSGLWRMQVRDKNGAAFMIKEFGQEGKRPESFPEWEFGMESKLVIFGTFLKKENNTYEDTAYTLWPVPASCMLGKVRVFATELPLPHMKELEHCASKCGIDIEALKRESRLSVKTVQTPVRSISRVDSSSDRQRSPRRPTVEERLEHLTQLVEKLVARP